MEEVVLDIAWYAANCSIKDKNDTFIDQPGVVLMGLQHHRRKDCATTQSQPPTCVLVPNAATADRPGMQAPSVVQGRAEPVETTVQSA